MRGSSSNHVERRLGEYFKWNENPLKGLDCDNGMYHIVVIVTKLS